MSHYKTIGIFGGTFDPIHFGHLRAAIKFYEQLSLEEIRLIPCKYPPHRATPIATAKDRLIMTKIAVQNSNLKVDEREMNREGPSYSVDTLMDLRKEHPKSSLCLIVGTDPFLNLHTWHEWEKLLQLANIVVMRRTSWNMPKIGTMAEILNQYQLSTDENIANFMAGKIIQHSVTSLDISATMIRSLIKKDLSARFLLPDNVYQYIQENRLYRVS